MHRDTNCSALPALTADLLQESGYLVDNLFADLWRQMGMKTLLSRAGFRKRSGTPMHELVYGLMLWVWLKVDSIGMFARESLKTFSRAEKDAFYDVMNREDLNWRTLHGQVAGRVARQLKGSDTPKALVLDDSIKIRHGKKMPGVSSHFDHTSGRHVMGQQVLTLGLSCAEGFVPIDSELFTSEVKAQVLHHAFRDGRSCVAKRYRAAQEQTKPQMAKTMIHRALSSGIEADYLLADAWFGTKPMIRLADEAYLTPILRMKKNKMKYRLTTYRKGNVQWQDLDVKSLYQQNIRGHWKKVPGQPYQANMLDVELNLSASQPEPEQWIKVRLLFVRGTVDSEKTQAGKHDWAVFLTPDVTLEPQRILELYALRWAIEVYFKEAKQHLGFLKEQGNHYAAYIASIHLAAIRFCFLLSAKQKRGACGISEIGSELSTNVTRIDFAARLWQVFRALITGALDELKTLLGESITLIMDCIELHIQRFFVQALQLDSHTLRLETM